MKIIIFSPAIWSFYLQRYHEIALNLSALKENNVIFVEPLRYKATEKNTSDRLKPIVKNTCPNSINLIIRTTKLRKGLLSLLYENFHNIKLINKFKPDVVIIYDPLSSFLLIFYVKILKIKLVFDCVDDWSELAKTKFQKFMIRFLITPLIDILSDLVIVTAQKLKEKMKKYNENVFLIPNGVDLHRFSKADTIKESENKSIIFIGSFGHWVDFNVLLNIAGEFKDVNFIFYGNGSQFANIREKSKNMSNVYVKGSIIPEKVPEIIARSTICVIPFKINKLTDSVCPIKLFEYWAMKKPVVCTPTFELQKIAIDKVLFAKSEAEWISAIRKLLLDENMCNRLGQAGYNEVVNKYNYLNLSKLYLNLLENY